MRDVVRIALESGDEHELEPGDMIGRMAGCALRIDDVRISEAHAMVWGGRRGRGGRGRRGRVRVDGRPRTRGPLAVGSRLVLAAFSPLRIVSARVSEQRFGVASQPATLGAAPDVTALARVVSLYADATRHPVTYFDPDADAHVIGGRAGPRLRRAGAPDLALASDSEFAIGARPFRLVPLDGGRPGTASTADRGQHDLALRITVRFDTVQIASESGSAVNLDGSAARVVSELAEIKAPVAWSELARILWKNPADSATRHRWDQLMLRIRQKLREAGIRSDLIRPTRNGLVELVLGPHDQIKLRP